MLNDQVVTTKYVISKSDSLNWAVRACCRGHLSLWGQCESSSWTDHCHCVWFYAFKPRRAVTFLFLNCSINRSGWQFGDSAYWSAIPLIFRGLWLSLSRPQFPLSDIRKGGGSGVLTAEESWVFPLGAAQPAERRTEWAVFSTAHWPAD